MSRKKKLRRKFRPITIAYLQEKDKLKRKLLVSFIEEKIQEIIMFGDNLSPNIIVEAPDTNESGLLDVRPSPALVNELHKSTTNVE